MEFYLAKDKSIALYRNSNEESTTSVVLEQGNVIPRDIQDDRSSVDVTNQQLTKLKECIGMLENPELENYRISSNQKTLGLKFSCIVAEPAVSGGGEGRTSSSKDEDPLPFKVELRGHALKVLKMAFGERIKIGFELEFQTNNYNDSPAADALSTISSSIY